MHGIRSGNFKMIFGFSLFLAFSLYHAPSTFILKCLRALRRYIHLTFIVWYVRITAGCVKFSD